MAIWLERGHSKWWQVHRQRDLGYNATIKATRIGCHPGARCRSKLAPTPRSAKYDKCCKEGEEHRTHSHVVERMNLWLDQKVSAKSVCEDRACKRVRFVTTTTKRQG
jgi:hypothetical protein